MEDCSLLQFAEAAATATSAASSSAVTATWPGEPHVFTRLQVNPGLYTEQLIVPSGSLWLFNIVMGNGPFIDGLPIINGDFPWLCYK